MINKIEKGERVVVFDCGNVLFDFRPSQKVAAKLLKISLDEFKTAWGGSDDQLCRGELMPDDFWDSLCLKYNYQGGQANFLDFWVRNFKKISQTHDLIKKLINKGIPVGLLTNIYVGTYEKALGRTIPRVNYKFVLQSCDLGITKPDSRIYDRATELSRVGSESIIFVDDSIRYIESGRAKGWRTVLFNPDKPSDGCNQVLDYLNLR